MSINRESILIVEDVINREIEWADGYTGDIEKAWEEISDALVYNEQAKEILWEYISSKDIPEIMSRLQELEGEE